MKTPELSKVQERVNQQVKLLLEKLPSDVKVEGRKVTLNGEWSALFEKYRQDHQNETNQVCHKVGIPLIAASIPTAITIVGLPLAAAMFTVGWGFQFAGHHFEGNDPSFFGDRRYLFVGALWWAHKFAGLEVVTTTDATAAAPAPEQPMTATA